ncbi:TetR family transcriptional regulator [Frondihabitans sp. PhB188]|uniref:TetR/AcrR family transcriptional regulator n=1 Tax=Frondihabitans sp. PhB188 TaxID=2485200 RepID=UPI000F494D69|nr:TetR/AcrR family transcriptional regulator [Frondihabitans sp. PhB188]ROQ31034.1 TetR family transcriptional regulator [Frondihabitans sp. PhB188]
MTTRTHIFETARLIVEKQGVEAVTIRRLAAEIGYTAPVVYQHFTDKAAVLDAVLEDGFRRLGARMLSSLALESPESSITVVLREYLKFAQQNRGVYLLMNGMTNSRPNPERRAKAAAPVVEATLLAISSWAAETNTTTSQTDDECDTLWGIAHGMASLGFLDHIGFDRAWALTTQAVDAITTSWKIKE